MNITLAVNLLVSLMEHAAAISQLIGRAHSEGRDVTQEELQTLFDADATAREQLAAAIAAAKAAGR